MLNTSFGFHTFSIFREVSSEVYAKLCREFKEHSQYDSDFSGYPLSSKQEGYIAWEYVYQENKGIRWKLSSRIIQNASGQCLSKRMIEAIINPRTLLENNYIAAATEADLNDVEAIFDERANEISELLGCFKNYTINRVDYCMNIDLEELDFPCTTQQLMQLIKKGNIPPYFSERKEYSATGHRYVTDSNSFYLISSAVIINFYLKYPQQTEKHPNYLYRDKSENVIRFEVQCRNKKLNELLNSMPELQPIAEQIPDYEKIKGKIPIVPMLSNEISRSVVTDYFNKVVGTGHYMTYKCACAAIDSQPFEEKTKQRLKRTLDFIKSCNGIAKTREKILEGYDPQLYSDTIIQFNKSLRKLNKLMINPVVIPESWGIKMIRNPLWVYNSLHNANSTDSIDELTYLKGVYKEPLFA